MLETVPDVDVEAGVAVFAGRLPSARELRTIREHGLGMRFVEIPTRHRDLGFLEDYADFIRHLRIGDAECRDVTPVLKLQRLESLHLYVDQSRPVEMSRLRYLKSFSGELRFFEDALNSSSLSKLSFQRAFEGELGPITAPVRDLHLLQARNLSMVPQLAQPELLEDLGIDGAKELSLDGIDSFTSLSQLSFSSCKCLTDADRLIRLDQLRALGFVGCREIEPQSALLQLASEHVSVVGRNPFDDRFRAQTTDLKTRWEFYKG